MTPNKTLHLESSYGCEEGANFVAEDDGGIIISITEEKAVDSYNDSFECTLHASPEQARALRDWINLQLLGYRTDV